MTFNSDKEKEIFQEYNWEYDYIQRMWISPNGYSITIDQLMQAVDEYGPNVEEGIREIAARYGQKST